MSISNYPLTSSKKQWETGWDSSLKSVERKVIPKRDLRDTKCLRKFCDITIFLLTKEEERQLVSTGCLTFRGEINPLLGPSVKVVFLYFFWFEALKKSSISKCWNLGILSTQKSHGFVQKCMNPHDQEQGFRAETFKGPTNFCERNSHSLGNVKSKCSFEQRGTGISTQKIRAPF